MVVVVVLVVRGGSGVGWCRYGGGRSCDCGGGGGSGVGEVVVVVMVVVRVVVMMTLARVKFPLPLLASRVNIRVSRVTNRWSCQNPHPDHETDHRLWISSRTWCSLV